MLADQLQEASSPWPKPLKSKWGHNGGLAVEARFHKAPGMQDRPQIMVTVRYAGTGTDFDGTGWDMLFTVRRYRTRALMRELPPQLIRAWAIPTEPGDLTPSDPQRLARLLPKGLYQYCKQQALKYTPKSL